MNSTSAIILLLSLLLCSFATDIRAAGNDSCRPLFNRWINSSIDEETRLKRIDVERLVTISDFDNISADEIRDLFETTISTEVAEDVSPCIQWMLTNHQLSDLQILELKISQIKELTRQGEYNQAVDIGQTVNINTPIEYLLRLRLALLTPLSELGRIDEASELLLDLLKNAPQSFFDNHRHIVYDQLALLHYANKDWQKARSIWIEDRSYIAPGTPIWIQITNSIASTLSNENRIAEARAVWQEIIEQSRSNKNSVSYLQAALNIANTYNKEGKFDEAIPLYQEVLNISRANQISLGIKLAYINLADAYADIGNKEISMLYLDSLLNHTSGELGIEIISSATKIYNAIKDSSYPGNDSLMYFLAEFDSLREIGSSIEQITVKLEHIEQHLRAATSRRLSIPPQENRSYMWVLYICFIVLIVIPAVIISNRRRIRLQNEQYHSENVNSVNHFNFLKLNYTGVILNHAYKIGIYKNVGLSLDIFCDTLGISKYRLNNILKENQIESFNRLISEMRVSGYIETIAATYPETDGDRVLVENGFHDSQSLRRAFKNVLGITPSEWIRDHEVNLMRRVA